MFMYSRHRCKLDRTLSTYLGSFSLQGHDVLSISPRVVIVSSLIVNKIGDAIVLLVRLGGAAVADYMTRINVTILYFPIFNLNKLNLLTICFTEAESSEFKLET